MNRRKFLKNTVASAPAALIPMEFIKPGLEIKSQLDIIVLATNWGFKGTIDEFCKRIKTEGFDGLEIWWSGNKEKQKELFDALQKYQLEVGFLTSGDSTVYADHERTFKINVDAATDSTNQKPLYVNCHSGKDYYSFDQNAKLIEYTLERTAKTGIDILHETHRSRMCFAAHITRQFLEKYPAMYLTLDISHWTNVHESMLDDQPENINLALQRVKHIHARIGHEEGPQVNDPRAPEWQYTFKKHLSWWDKAIENRVNAGGKRMTFLTEFGPPNYLPTVPYTGLPLADQWDINGYMMKFIKERYK
jgi:sugar phosphate isomerase/epimerase